jgi:hypothetical protein
MESWMSLDIGADGSGYQPQVVLTVRTLTLFHINGLLSPYYYFMVNRSRQHLL